MSGLPGEPSAPAAVAIAPARREWSWHPGPEARDARPIHAVLGDPAALDADPPLAEPFHSSPRVDDQGRPESLLHRTAAGHFRVRFSDGTEFSIDASGTAVRGRWPEPLTLEDALIYLEGPVLGLALRVQGVTCLHASAADVDGRAVAVVGDAGMGKSTSAAAFARLGFGVLTDDVLPLSDLGTSFLALPGVPRLLLWPESVEALWGDAEALPRIVPTWPKRVLQLGRAGHRFCAEALPLGGVYLLGDRAAPGAPPSIEPIGGTGALIRLVANTYGNRTLDREMRARELDVLGRLVSHVPVRLVRAPEDRAAVPAVCQAIAADFRAMIAR